MISWRSDLLLTGYIMKPWLQFSKPKFWHDNVCEHLGLVVLDLPFASEWPPI